MEDFKGPGQATDATALEVIEEDQGSPTAKKPLAFEENGPCSSPMRELNDASWNSRASIDTATLDLCEVNTASWNSTGSRFAWCGAHGGTQNSARSLRDFMEDLSHFGPSALEAIAEDSGSAVPAASTMPAACGHATAPTAHAQAAPALAASVPAASAQTAATITPAVPTLPAATAQAALPMELAQSSPTVPTASLPVVVPPTAVCGTADERLRAALVNERSEGHVLVAVPMSRLEAVTQLLMSPPST